MIGRSDMNETLSKNRYQITLIIMLHQLVINFYKYCFGILSWMIRKEVQFNQQEIQIKSNTKLKNDSWKRRNYENKYLAILLSINFAIVALFALFTTPIRAAIRPNCRCIIFDDTFDKEYGVFTSPDWPVPYVPWVNCLTSVAVIVLL